MLGRILGFDTAANTGTITGNDGLRYNFEKASFKENIEIKKDLKVDFNVAENGQAIEIYSVKDSAQENASVLFGLLAVGLTFFLGFIGTFISRLVLAKQPIGEVIVPTLIHFVITLLIFIPILGWLIYIAGTGYYMYKNYVFVTATQA